MRILIINTVKTALVRFEKELVELEVLAYFDDYTTHAQWSTTDLENGRIRHSFTGTMENGNCSLEQLKAIYSLENAEAFGMSVPEPTTLSEEEQQEFLQELGLEESGLERLARVAYEALALQSFLTAGEIEVRAWTIPQGTLAPVAAGVIHTDFEKKFIKANVASFEDFVEYGGWKGVKEVGKMRMEGRDYPMQDGDIVEFLIGK